MSVSKEDKSDLGDINARFVQYVSRVRHLRGEEDLAGISQSIALLEGELGALKCSYEAQISQLRATVDALVQQKTDCERELAARRTSENHLGDRLTVESSKNSKLLQELSCLRSDVSAGEQEIISLNLIIKQLRLELKDAALSCEKLERSLNESTAKNIQNEEKIRDFENQIVCLNQKIQFQDHYFTEKIENMKSQQEECLQKMVSMDCKVEEAQQRESQWPDILDKIKKSATDECNAFKAETEAFYNERVTYLQHQLESEVSENAQLKQNNELINDKLLSMRKQEADLNSTIDCLQRRVEIMEKALLDDKQESEKVIQSLQNKIRELQQHIYLEIDQVRNDKSSNNVSIRGEIEFIKRLLTEEERRLNIKPEYPLIHSTAYQKVNEVQDNERVHNEDEKKILLKPGFHPTVTVNTSSDEKDSQDKGVYNENIDYVSEEDVEEHNHNRYINNLSAEENQMYECDGDRQKESQYQEGYQGQSNNAYVVLSDQSQNSNNYDEKENIHLWTEKIERSVLRPDAIVGPISHQDSFVGPVRPIRPISSTPYPPSERPPRPSSANLRGTRTKSCVSHHESMSKDCPSRSSNNFTDSGLGQSPDYFDSLFKARKEKKEEVNIINTADINSLSPTSLTSLKILEVNKDGKYVRIWNSSDKQDAEIGGYIIKQNRFGHPISVFRFPDRVKFPANGTITIWAGSTDPLLHQPPTDFFSPQPLIWGSSPEFTTILCNNLGQALSWTVTPHRIKPDPFRAKTAPAVGKEGQRANSPKLPELLSNNLTMNNEQIYIIKDNHETLSQPIHHPFTSTPKSTIHPCMEGNRGKTLGNDNSSFNRQTRQQCDNIPDPMIGHPYAGNNSQRLLGSAKVMHYYPPTIQPSHSINNGMSEVMFRSCVEPPNAFQKPQSRFITGLDQVQSMHNNLFFSRMYKTESNPSVK